VSILFSTLFDYSFNRHRDLSQLNAFNSHSAIELINEILIEYWHEFFDNLITMCANTRILNMRTHLVYISLYCNLPYYARKPFDFFLLFFLSIKFFLQSAAMYYYRYNTSRGAVVKKSFKKTNERTTIWRETMREWEILFKMHWTSIVVNKIEENQNGEPSDHI